MHIEMSSDKCSGCTACKAVCPKNAIRFSDDAEGFKIPSVSSELCLECGACTDVCPALSYKTTERDNAAYAGMWKNDKIRENSSSGAFFPATAKYFIEELHGYVCGCVLDENLMPIHIVTNSLNDVKRMSDSKYVQSDMGDCFSEIYDLLSRKYYVLFAGTSCQVQGLIALLNIKKVNMERLLTIDFFCHGVPSPFVWNEYLKFYEKETKRKIIGYRFRNKYTSREKLSVPPHLNCVHYSYRNTSKNKKDNFSFASRMWRIIFFSNICLRRYCHKCPYATIDKPSDITMGDFWGIDEIAPEINDGKGVSIIITHNEKGKNYLNRITYLNLKQVNSDIAIKKQANAFHPSPENKRRDEFWNDFHSKPFTFVAKKYFRYTIKFRILYFIDRVLFELGIHKLRW